MTISKHSEADIHLMKWVSYWRANIHRFVMDYFHIDLKIFQQILLVMMNSCNFFMMITARGLGKSFLSAIFCCARAVLYPGTKIVIASGTRGQAINVLEKIKNELMPLSPELTSEISGVLISNTNASITFRNGSFIKVVTASDSARGARANILLIDEFRMVDKDTIDTVLKKFLTSHRLPRYLSKPEYKDMVERNKEIYLSSAWFTSHWSYEKVKAYFKNMVDDTKKYFVCGLPYMLSIKEGLLDRGAVEDEMSESNFNEVRFQTEMCAEWFGDTDGSFFDYDSIANNRHIQTPLLPDRISNKLADKRFKIPPKQNGEKRILSADIALMSSTKNKNDAASMFINQLLPGKYGRYIENIVYTENAEGLRTEVQALMIRRLYEWYDCDYIVIDAKGLGIGVVDSLMNEIVDPDTGDVYPPLSCCNNDEIASRCVSANAPKVIWAIMGSQKFNSDCAILLREGFKSGKIKLLISEFEADEILNAIKGFSSLSTMDKLKFQMPYINTTLLINELINLKHEEVGGVIKISEKSGFRKDRYSSLSYNHYVACQLEMKVRRRNASETTQSIFMFRAPKIK